MKTLLRRFSDLLRRLGGVVRKEITEIVRQPGLLLILVIGPLGILLLFGSGVRATDPPVRAVFVAPEQNAELTDIVSDYAETQSERLTLVDVTTDAEDADRQLREAEIDLLIIFPDVSLQDVLAEDRPTIVVRHRLIDPLEVQAIRLFTTSAVAQLNDILVSQAIAETQAFAVGFLESDDRDLSEALADPDALADPEMQELIEDLLTLDPAIIAAPLAGETEGIGGAVTTSQFYAPAVVALILQHLTITFVALTVSRERHQGTTELFAVSPLRPVEHLIGRALAYLLIGAALGAAMMAAVVLLLGAPIRGGVVPVVLVLLLLLLGSIGLGFVLAAVSRTTTQVVQGAMLLLLLSVFFGGLLLSPERLLPWAEPIGWILPMTHALALLRDSMLRGVPADPVLMGVLAVMAAVFSLFAVWHSRRANRLG